MTRDSDNWSWNYRADNRTDAQQIIKKGINGENEIADRWLKIHQSLAKHLFITAGFGCVPIINTSPTFKNENDLQLNMTHINENISENRSVLVEIKNKSNTGMKGEESMFRFKHDSYHNCLDHNIPVVCFLNTLSQDSLIHFGAILFKWELIRIPKMFKSVPVKAGSKKMAYLVDLRKFDFFTWSTLEQKTYSKSLSRLWDHAEYI